MLVLTACRGEAHRRERHQYRFRTLEPIKSLPKIVAFATASRRVLAFHRVQATHAPAKKLDADGFAYEVVNAGVSGDTSAGGLDASTGRSMAASRS